VKLDGRLGREQQLHLEPRADLDRIVAVHEHSAEARVERWIPGGANSRGPPEDVRVEAGVVSAIEHGVSFLCCLRVT
jgi:hypothetical protein